VQQQYERGKQPHCCGKQTQIVESILDLKEDMKAMVEEKAIRDIELTARKITNDVIQHFKISNEGLPFQGLAIHQLLLVTNTKTFCTSFLVKISCSSGFFK
jgi:hypothetical protein